MISAILINDFSLLFDSKTANNNQRKIIAVTANFCRTFQLI